MIYFNVSDFKIHGSLLANGLWEAFDVRGWVGHLETPLLALNARNEMKIKSLEFCLANHAQSNNSASENAFFRLPNWLLEIFLRGLINTV